MDNTNRLLNVVLEENVIKRSPIVENERATAVRDLIEQNTFELNDKSISGPYILVFSLDDVGLKINAKVRDENENELYKFTISIRPFRRLLKDYMYISESYYEAMRTLSAPQIETMDMAKRGMHNEGADLLQKVVETNVKIDFDTARRLFTLITVMHIR